MMKKLYNKIVRNQVAAKMIKVIWMVQTKKTVLTRTALGKKSLSVTVLTRYRRKGMKRSLMKNLGTMGTGL